MKRYLTGIVLLISLTSGIPISAVDKSDKYIPSPEVLQSRKEFADDRFGIFIHWGIYSLFGQGEWYLNYDVNADEYKKAAKAFYPIDFNAHDWVRPSRKQERNISASHLAIMTDSLCLIRLCLTMI